MLVLQNGVDHRDRVASISGPAAVLPAVIWCPAEPTGPGLVRQRGPARLVVADDADGRRAAALLAGSRVQVEGPAG